MNESKRANNDQPVSARALAAYGGFFVVFVGLLSALFVALSPSKSLSARDVATYGSSALFLMTGFVFVLVALNVVRYDDPTLRKRVITVSLGGIVSGVLGVSVSSMAAQANLSVDDCVSEFQSQLEEPDTQNIEVLADQCLDVLTQIEAQAE